MNVWWVAVPGVGTGTATVHRTDVVEADRMTMEGGCLAFYGSSGSQYDLVVAYGPGAWATVTPARAVADGGAVG